MAGRPVDIGLLLEDNLVRLMWRNLASACSLLKWGKELLIQAVAVEAVGKGALLLKQLPVLKTQEVPLQIRLPGFGSGRANLTKDISIRGGKEDKRDQLHQRGAPV